MSNQSRGPADHKDPMVLGVVVGGSVRFFFGKRKHAEGHGGVSYRWPSVYVLIYCDCCAPAGDVAHGVASLCFWALSRVKSYSRRPWRFHQVQADPASPALPPGIWNGDAWSVHVGAIAGLVLVFVACTALSAKVFRWE